MGNQPPKSNITDKNNSTKNISSQNKLFETQKDFDLISRKSFIYEDNFFDDLGTYCDGDQINGDFSRFDSIPQRNAYNTYPFKSIGRVISVYEDIQADKVENFPYGSGTIINPRVVLTVAHNLYPPGLKKIPDHVYFQPEVSSDGNNEMIKVKRWGIHKRFFNKNGADQQLYDVAILILEQNTIIKPQMVMKVNLKFQFNPSTVPQILISGYPKGRNLHSQRYIQHYYTMPAFDSNGIFISYEHPTDSGNSGCPILMKESGSSGASSFSLIGVHKGVKGDKKYGILTNNRNPNELISVLRQWTISEDNRSNVLESKNLEVEKFILQLQLKQKNNQVTDDRIYIGNIAWSKENQVDLKIDSFLSLTTGNSYSKSIGQIQSWLLSLDSQKSLLSQQLWKYLFKKLKVLYLNETQQTAVLHLIEKLVDENMGLSQLADQVNFLCQIAEKFYYFLNKVEFKTKSWLFRNKQQALDTLSQLLFAKKQSILQKIQNNYSNSVDKTKRQQQRFVRQLIFSFKLKDLSRTYSYLDFSPEESKKILALKGQIMKFKGNFVEAQKLFETCLEKYFKNDNFSEEYANVIKSLGQVYRIQSKYQLAAKCFQKNRQIQQKLKGKDSLGYAESLIFLSYIEIQKGNYLQAINLLSNSIQIASKLSEQQPIQVSKANSHLGVVYFYRKDYKKSFQYSQKALATMENIQGKDSIDCVQIISNIGAALKSLDKNDQALRFYERSLKITQKHWGKDNIFCATVLNNIGHMYLNLKDHAKAKQYFNRSIAIYEKAKQINQPAYALALFNLALVFEATKEKQKAKKYSNDSYLILKEVLGSQNKWTKNSQMLFERCSKK